MFNSGIWESHSLTGIYVGEREKRRGRKGLFKVQIQVEGNIQGNIQSKSMQHHIIKNMNIQILIFTTFQYIHNMTVKLNFQRKII